MRVVVIDPKDPNFAPLFELLPNAGLFLAVDTERDGIDVVAVAGRHVFLPGGPINLPRARAVQMAPASLLEFSANPKCKWLKFDGTSILVSGNPDKCVERD
jgi:hypothetical protein